MAIGAPEFIVAARHVSMAGNTYYLPVFMCASLDILTRGWGAATHDDSLKGRPCICTQCIFVCVCSPFCGGTHFPSFRLGRSAGQIPALPDLHDFH